MKLAILDDYQHVALKMADWSAHREALPDRRHRPPAAGARRSSAKCSRPMTSSACCASAPPRRARCIEKLPNLKLLAITGAQHRTLDLDAADRARHSRVPHQRAWRAPIRARRNCAIALMLAAVRHIPQEDRRTREGRWQGSVGIQLYGRTLGIVGLGKIGRKVARVARGAGGERHRLEPEPHRRLSGRGRRNARRKGRTVCAKRRHQPASWCWASARAASSAPTNSA